MIYRGEGINFGGGDPEAGCVVGRNEIIVVL